MRAFDFLSSTSRTKGGRDGRWRLLFRQFAPHIGAAVLVRPSLKGLGHRVSRFRFVLLKVRGSTRTAPTPCRRDAGRRRKRRDLRQEIFSLVVYAPTPFAQPHERRQFVPQPSSRLLVRESGKTAEVTPVRTGRIANESSGQFLGDLGAQFLIENPAVIEPDLKILR